MARIGHEEFQLNLRSSMSWNERGFLFFILRVLIRGTLKSEKREPVRGRSFNEMRWIDLQETDIILRFLERISVSEVVTKAPSVLLLDV